MATLIDPVEDNLEETPNVDEQQQEATLEVEVAPEPKEPSGEDDIPEKYRGKDLADLVRMHQEAEKALGKQGSEVGELRKVVDQFISSQLPEAPEPVQEEEVDWFADPDEALNKKLENHPTIKAIEEKSQKDARESNKAQLEKLHPDYRDILQEEGFADWIRQSKVRSRLLVEADQNYDTDAADELFTLYKERRQIAKDTAEADKEVRKQEVAKASNGGARGTSNPSPKKKYRRADIIELMNTDPDRYQALAPEFLQAYKEKRVY